MQILHFIRTYITLNWSKNGLYLTYNVCIIIETFFSSIPRSEELRAKWIAVIGKNVSNYSKVCSDHFKPNFFKYKINKPNKIQRHLIKGAIPTEENARIYTIQGKFIISYLSDKTPE